MTSDRAASVRRRYLAAIAVDAAGSGMYLPLSMLYFHHTLGLSFARIGAILTAAAVLGLVSNPVTGILVDRYGPRAVVTGGYLLRALAFISYPIVGSPRQLFAAAAVVALCDVSFPPSIQSLIAEIARGAERDRLIAVQRSLRNAGLGAGGLLAGAALALSSTVAYHLIVLTSAAAFLLAAGLIRSIPGRRPPRGACRVARGARRGTRSPSGYRLVARNRPFLALALLNLPTAFGYMVLAVALPVYLTQVLGQPSSLVGFLYAVNTVGIAALQLPVTRVLVRFRRTRTVAAGAAVFAAAFVAFAGFSAMTSPTVLLVGVFGATAAFTAGELLHGATASALVAGAAPEQTRGRHLAVYQLSWAVPSALAPAVLTALLSYSPVVMWLVLAAGASASALGMLRLERHLPGAAVRTGAGAPALERPTAVLAAG